MARKHDFDDDQDDIDEHDDLDDRDEDSDSDRSPRTRRLLRRLAVWGLALAGIGLGFLIPYTLYLNQQVTERFGALRWQVPTRVYARPLTVAAGVAMDERTLKTELGAASYRDDGRGERPGTYALKGSRWTISSRGFEDVGGSVGPSRIELTLSGGRIRSVRDLVGSKPVRYARLDPARIATLYGQNQEERRLVRVSEVPGMLTDALQAVEDRDFARHHGIDPMGMMRGVFVWVKTLGKVKQGGSTLTQQLARSGLLGIGKEQTLTRKFNEILYAIIIDARYDKGVIMEAYLNQVDVGQNGSQAIHGFASGAEFYFGRQLDELNTEHVALLVALVKGPSWYNPRKQPERALARRNLVLEKMLETGIIDQQEHDRARKAPLGVTEVPGSMAANRFPAYIDLVRRQLARDYPRDAISGAGLSVMTGMSPSAQAYAEGAVKRTLDRIGSAKRPPLQAGMVVTDVHTGQVLAVVGSRSFQEHGFNRALDAQRPVGSLLKPFVYLLALSQPDRFTLATPVDDSPVSVLLDGGKRWTPTNSDRRSHGTVSLLDALAKSYNQSTVRVGMEVGPERLADFVRTVSGIDPERNPALILGSTDQSPYAMAQLYQFLASTGQVQPLYSVRGVLDAEGKALNRYDNPPKPAQAGDAVAARLVAVALQQAVTAGTARPLLRDGLGRLSPAGKTGTSNDSRDSWFAGWTGDHLAVVWVGNDQNQPTGLFGATGAMQVWSGLFTRLPSAALQPGNAGLEFQWVIDQHSTDAECPGAQRYAFVAGFAPPYRPCLIDNIQQMDPAGEGDGEGGVRGFFERLFERDAPPAEPPPPEADAAAMQREREAYWRERESQARRRQAEQDADWRRRQQEDDERARLAEARVEAERERREREDRERREREYQERLAREREYREAREREYLERRREDDARRRREEEERRREQDYAGGTAVLSAAAAAGRAA